MADDEIYGVEDNPGDDLDFEGFYGPPGKKKTKTTPTLSYSDLTRIVESPGYIQEYLKDRKAFFPSVDFADPASFAKFGLAEEYYKNAIENIYKTYPYDGSLKEKIEWHNNASYIDNYVFENEYPRTNGYVNIGFPWNNSSTTTKTVGVDRYILSDAAQYISFKGGPHAPSIPSYAGAEYSKELTVKTKEQKANVFDSTGSQIQNMTINGQAGNTVEFWFKYPTNPLSDQGSDNFSYFDLWNEQTIGSVVPGSEYGRFLIETKLAHASNNYQENCMFNITYRSGSSGVYSAKLGSLSGAPLSNVATDYGIDLTSWNHFAFSVKNNPTGSHHLLMHLYINGNLVETVHTGSQINEVKEGPFNANLGAYRSGPNASAVSDGVVDGYGSISGSFDEFRFWTNQRTSEEIKIFHRSHVGGGTNTDYGDSMSKYSGSLNPVDLGVYFKFNEGVVGNNNADKTVLDYSGRVTNGTFNNYNSNCRSTSSAIVEASASAREFKDPIVYSFHSSVQTYMDSAIQKGKEYDDRNTMGLYYGLPGWILDEDSEKSNYTIKNLTQIIASYFDDLYLQTRQLPDFKHNTYPSGSLSGSFVQKPLPFANKLLSNMGFVTPEIFTDVNEITEFMNRDEERIFEKKLFDIRNQIYYNIYNNANYINKSKGTEKSIRNLLRCFGVNDDIYSINFYANNAKLDLRRAAQLKSAKKTYVDFSNKDNFGATVFQNTASSNSNSVSFITGSNKAGGLANTDAWDAEIPITVEAEVIFPFKPGEIDPGYESRKYSRLTSSLFGVHTAWIDPTALTPTRNDNDLTWAFADYANFQAYAVRDKIKNPDSSNVKFVLTGSNVNSTTESIIPELTSSFYDNVYNNEKWNFSVKIKPNKYPNVGKLSGSEKTDYLVEWRGYNVVGDIVQNEFFLTASISETNGLNFSKSKKRLYAGSHRTNFTGSLLHGTDVKISSCRWWANDLSEEELLFHAMDPKNYGVFNSIQNSFPLDDTGQEKATAIIANFAGFSNNDDFSITVPANIGGTGAAQIIRLSSTDATGASSTAANVVAIGVSSGPSAGTVAETVVDAINGHFGSGGAYNHSFASANASVNTGVVGVTAVLVGSTQIRITSDKPGLLGNSIAVANITGNAATNGNLSGGTNAILEIPRLKTLILNWDFETLTGSDIAEYNGEFSSPDFSSGSSDSRYGANLSSLLEKQHTGRGAYFKPSNNYTGSFSRETVYGMRQQVPDNLNNSEAIQILSRDDELFTPFIRPISFKFSIEKSMYQSISEEMVNFLAATKDSTDLENLIGQPVHRYRMDYKSLEKIRNIFFERVGNTPDLEKYLNYFKWLDSSVSMMIMNTIPASSEFSQISNVIESHTFERNKYWSKFPTIEYKAPGEQPQSAVYYYSSNETKTVVNRDETGRPVTGLIADAMKSKERRTNWSQAHQPVGADSSNLKKSVDYWSKKADRSDSALTSGDAGVDRLRNNIRDVLGETLRIGSVADIGSSVAIPGSNHGNSFGKRQLPADLGFNLHINRSRPKHGMNKRGFVFSTLKPGSPNNIVFNTTTFQSGSDYDWATLYPTRKYKPEFELNVSSDLENGLSGRTMSPYEFYSGSMPTGIYPGLELSSQHHRDYYLETKDVPLQGPFTERNVGGYAYRHSGLQLLVGQTTLWKPEAWYASRTLAGGNLYFTLSNPYNLPLGFNLARAEYFRDETAKRPVNIKNIKSTTSSYLAAQTTLPPVDQSGIVKNYVGNYEKDYQILTVGGRDINNRYLVRSGSISTASIQSIGTPSVSGAYDWEVPNRGRSEHIIVSRFSSPGGPETAGAAFNDYTSDTFSPYNALPFRNLSVRQPLNTLLNRHVLFGGYDSVYESPSASYFKTQRNTAKRLERTDSGNLPLKATAIIANFAGFSSNDDFSITVPASIGGTGVVQIIRLSPTDATGAASTAANVVAIGVSSGPSAGTVAETVVDAINGHFGSGGAYNHAFASANSGVNTGVVGVTAVLVSSTQIRITADQFGPDGNDIVVANITGNAATNGNLSGGIYASVSYTTVTSSIYDNYWVQHTIPQSDRQYSWITASATSFPLGYQQKDFSEKTFASTDTTFVSGSITGSNQLGGGLINTDFAGLNSVIVNSTELSGTSPNNLSFSANTDLCVPATQATAVIADFSGFSNNDDFSITVPVSIGGTGVVQIIRLSSTDATGAASTAANVVAIGVNTGPSAGTVAETVVDAINGHFGTGGSYNHAFASGNIGSNTGVVGVTAVLVGSTQIRITADKFGSTGNDIAVANITGNAATNGNLSGGQNDRDISTFLNGTLVLNAINSTRGGSSLLKNASLHYHPLARELRYKNIISLVKEVPKTRVGSTQNYIVSREYVRFTEPPITFKYKPLEHEIVMNDGNKVYLDSSYANNLCGFANSQINNLIDFYAYKDKNTSYHDLKKIYIDKEVPDEYLPFESLDSLSYKEAVYPREVNTGFAKARGRENYTVSSGSTEFNARLGDSRVFWKDNINDRLRSDADTRNAQGLIITSGSSYFGLTDMSIWPLDSEEPFYDLYAVSSSDAGAGGYDPYYWAPLTPSSSDLNPSRITRLKNVNKNGELSYAGYIYGIFGINIQGKIRLDGAPTASGPFPNYLSDFNFKPSASFQYEYPNMMMSGSVVSANAAPTASLHLMAPYRTNVLSGKSPWFDSYEDYSEDIRRLAKDHTVLPEFRVSDHMDYYLKEGFFADNNKFLDLIGSSLPNTSSAANETGSFQADFFKIYSHSDFMKHFSIIQEDHKKNNTAFASRLKLEVNAVKKLLPYQGFYPALRSVQLGQLFSSSYAPYISGSNVRDGEQERLAALYQPFYAPGIFFNTIKSGIAVSYPVHTASAPDVATGIGYFGQPTPASASAFISNQYVNVPNYSFPFEAILDPDQYLPLSSSLTSSAVNSLSSSVYMVYPNFTGSTRTDAMDGFYAKQTADSPYNAARAAALGVSRNQPQMYFEWQGQSDPKYSLAASNFFAESVDFFLDNGTLTSFVSKAEKDFKSMASGSTYYMDVLLFKTEDFISYEGPSEGVFEYRGGLLVSASLCAAHASHANWHNRVATYGDGLVNTTVGARGMHYGPSYQASPFQWGSSGTGSVPYASFRAQDPSYAPHTPPYFYGTSRARIAFKPHIARDMGTGEAAKFTLEEILSNAKVETAYENENERAKTLQENIYRNNYAAGQAQMQLSSSINLFGQTTLKEIQYGTEKGSNGSFKPQSATTPVVQGTNDAWIIESKFECPSVNLAHMDTASLGAAIGDGKEKYHTRGIWKGYGDIPTGSEGIFLQLKESYPQVTNDIGGAESGELTGSLIDVCGFKASKERVGKIRSKKTISEAIVAVPIDEKGHFYYIDSDMYAKQKLNYEKDNKALLAGDFGVEKDIGKTSITQMIEKMEKFSLPPQMDFLNNPNVNPFVMYIFEFKHTLDKQDLADIWQNLMPEISRTAEKESSSIEHDIGVNYEFFGQYKKGELPDNIRWMVFKVKQKARNNYFNITQQSEVAKGFTFTAFKELQGFASSPEAELAYSYNWPYDFFSLVELAQIESEIVFESPSDRYQVDEIDKKTGERSSKVIYERKKER